MRSFLFKRGFILPVTVTGLIPLLIAVSTGTWRATVGALIVTGAILYASGLTLTFAVGMGSHIVLQEEPLLRSRFGESYDRYCRNVPRWLPRTKPYQTL